MQAGLARFGSDFGNGEADQRFFPRDATTPRYLAEKARVLTAHPAREALSLASPADEACVAAAQVWFRETLRREGQGVTASLARAELGRELVEDFAVLRRDDTGADRVLWLHACFRAAGAPSTSLVTASSKSTRASPAFDANREEDAQLGRGAGDARAVRALRVDGHGRRRARFIIRTKDDGWLVGHDRARLLARRAANHGALCRPSLAASF